MRHRPGCQSYVCPRLWREAELFTSPQWNQQSQQPTLGSVPIATSWEPPKDSKESPFPWQKPPLISVSAKTPLPDMAENVVSLPLFAFQRRKMSKIIVFSESARNFFKEKKSIWSVEEYFISFYFLYMMALIFFTESGKPWILSPLAFVLFWKTLELRKNVGITCVSV